MHEPVLRSSWHDEGANSKLSSSVGETHPPLAISLICSIPRRSISGAPRHTCSGPSTTIPQSSVLFVDDAQISARIGQARHHHVSGRILDAPTPFAASLKSRVRGGFRSFAPALCLLRQDRMAKENNFISSWNPGPRVECGIFTSLPIGGPHLLVGISIKKVMPARL